jgi:hypothetical protein
MRKPKLRSHMVRYRARLLIQPKTQGHQNQGNPGRDREPAKKCLYSFTKRRGRNKSNKSASWVDPEPQQAGMRAKPRGHTSDLGAEGPKKELWQGKRAGGRLAGRGCSGQSAGGSERGQGVCKERVGSDMQGPGHRVCKY